MRLFNFISAAVLGLLLAAAVPGHSQEEDKSQQEHPQTAKPDERPQEERKAEPQPERRDAKPAPAEEKRSPQEEKQAQQEQKREERTEKQAQKQEQNEAKRGQKEEKQERVWRAGRIPDDQFRAHFGREHTFRIGQPVMVAGMPRFQYAGFWFVIEQPWPAGWYYTDEFYVDYIEGLYYLCDPLHPGVLITLTVLG